MRMMWGLERESGRVNRAGGWSQEQIWTLKLSSSVFEFVQLVRAW